MIGSYYIYKCADVTVCVWALWAIALYASRHTYQPVHVHLQPGCVETEAIPSMLTLCSALTCFSAILQVLIAGGSSEHCAQYSSPASNLSYLVDASPGANHIAVQETMHFPRVVRAVTTLLLCCLLCHIPRKHKFRLFGHAAAVFSSCATHTRLLHCKQI